MLAFADHFICLTNKPRCVKHSVFWKGIGATDTWVWEAECVDPPPHKLLSLTNLSRPGRIRDMPEWLDEHTALTAVQYNPQLIRFIDRPSAAVQRVAVMQDVTAFHHISDPDPQVQSDAVFMSPFALLCIGRIAPEAMDRWNEIPFRRREAWCLLYPVLTAF